jgi:hypothetical protein
VYATVTAPSMLPLAVGVKVTEITHVAPAKSDVPHGVPLAVNE